MSLRSTAAALTLGLAAVGLPLAATAAEGGAGTIVYVHDDDVWISTADGSTRRALTTDGTAASPYRWPSEDDNGHVVALRDNGFVILDQSGRTLDTYAQPLAASSALEFASVSPDGTRIGFSVIATSNVCDGGGCGQEWIHEFHRLDTGTGALATDDHGIAYRETGSWASNDRTVLASETAEVDYQDRGSEAQLWYADCDYTRPALCPTNPEAEYWHAFPAVSRQGDRYASVVFDQGIESPEGGLTFLDVMDTAGFGTGGPPAQPTGRCTITGLDTTVRGSGVHPGLDELTLQTPSWSPDGRSLAVAIEGAGAHWQVWRIDVGTDPTDCGAYDGAAIIDDATMPRWSPAPLTTPGPPPTPGPTPTTGPAPTADPAPQHTQHRAKHRTHTRLTAPRRAKRRHRVRLVVKVRPRAVTGRVRLRDGRHTLRRVRLRHGRAAVRVRLRAGRHRLHAVYLGNRHYRRSSSPSVTVRVRR